MVSLGVTPRSMGFHAARRRARGFGMRVTQGEIRRKLGFTRDTLRFYEQKGIIQPEVDPANGYRYYDDWQVNLLWECKEYQAMGFSLAEVAQILQEDGLTQIERRMRRRISEAEREVRLRQLELAQLKWRTDLVHRAPRELGRIELVGFKGRAYVPMRKVHDLAAEASPSAVAFMNEHMALTLPLCLFPNLGGDQYYWGFAMTPEVLDELMAIQPEGEGRPDGLLRVEPARALATWVDAGERWNFGIALFDGLLREARARGLEPRGELCGDLIVRSHEADGFHRYVHAFLPLA